MTPRLETRPRRARRNPRPDQDGNLGRRRLEPARHPIDDRLCQAATRGTQHPALMSGSSRIRAAQEHWESVARFVLGAFRADAARAGATTEITKLVEELSRTSPDFDRLWRDNVVAHGEGLKRIRHAELGLIELEFSAFAVDGRPELGRVVYNPANDTLPPRSAVI